MLFCSAELSHAGSGAARGWPSLFLLEDSQLVGDFYGALWDVGRRAGVAVGRTFQGAELQEMHM